MNANVNVLILEDNRQMRTLLRAMLDGMGFTNVRTADSVQEAIELCRGTVFDIALVDLKLREESGLRFVKWLRMSPNTPDCYMRVIAVTSFAERSRILEAINAGIDEFLAKPVRPIDICRRIQSVVNRKREFVKTKNYFGPCRRRLKAELFKGEDRRKANMPLGVRQRA